MLKSMYLFGKGIGIGYHDRTIESITPQVTRLGTKAKNLNIVLPLSATLLTVSKKDSFLKNWPTLIEEIVLKFKEKALKEIALTSVCRLVWTYLYRCYDSPSSLVQKRIDWFITVLFPSKRVISPTECDLDIFVRIAYYILVKYPEYGNECLIAHLISSDIKKGTAQNNESFATNRSEVNLEELPCADRLLIAFRSFLLLLRDVEQSIGDSIDNMTTAGALSHIQSSNGLVLVEGKINLKPPKFPSFEGISEYSVEYLQEIGSRENQNRRQKQYVNSAPLNTPLSQQLQLRLGTSMRDTFQLINNQIGQTFLVLDNALGYKSLFEPGLMVSTGNTYLSTSLAYSSSTSPNFGVAGLRRHSAVVDTLNSLTGLPTRQEIPNADLGDSKTSETSEVIYIRLFRCMIDMLPRFTPTGVSPIKVVEVLSKFAGLHYDKTLRNASFQALCRIAKVKRYDPQSTEWIVGMDGEMDSAGVYRIFNDAILKTITGNFKDLWYTGEKLESSIIHATEVNLELLDIWLEDVCTTSNYMPSRSEADGIVQAIESQGNAF